MIFSDIKLSDLVRAQNSGKINNCVAKIPSVSSESGRG